MLLPGTTTSWGSARHTTTGGGGALLMLIPILTDAPAVAGTHSAIASASREHQGRTRLIRGLLSSWSAMLRHPPLLDRWPRRGRAPPWPGPDPHPISARATRPCTTSHVGC